MLMDAFIAGHEAGTAGTQTPEPTLGADLAAEIDLLRSALDDAQRKLLAFRRS